MTRTQSRPVHSSARLATLIALSLLLAWISASALGATETPDLSGSWEMDKELSEDPMEKMRQGRGGGMSGGGGRGGGGWGGGPGGGRGGGPGGGMGGGPGGGRGGIGSGPGQGSGESREEMRERMQELRASLERLQISQTDSSVRITYADSREQDLITDNKKTAIDTPFGDGTVKARWRDGGLVVKTKTERRKTTETYYVTKDGKMLTVLVEMEGEGPMGSSSFKRIYRPAPTPETPSPATPS